MSWNKITAIVGICFFSMLAKAQITPEALVDSMKWNHGKLKSAQLLEEIYQLKTQQSWRLPQTDFNLQQGQINASNWDYYLTISQSFDGIWQKKSLEKFTQSQGKLCALENQILLKELTLDLKEFIWLYLQTNQWKGILYQQKEMIAAWKNQISQQTKAGYASEWELWVVNQQFQKMEQEESRVNQQIYSLKKSIELYSQVEINQGITAWELLKEPTKSELSPLFSEFLAVLELSYKNESQWLQSQKFPTPYIGAFRQQLESVPGYVGVVTGVKVPLNYDFLKREKGISQLEFEKEFEVAKQELKAQKIKLEQNLQQLESEKINFSKAQVLEITDQKGLLEWLKNNQKVGNKSLLEQSQLYNTYWENQKMIQEIKIKLGLLILQNQYLTQ